MPGTACAEVHGCDAEVQSCAALRLASHEVDHVKSVITGSAASFDHKSPGTYDNSN